MGYKKYIKELYRNFDENRELDEDFRQLWIQRKKRWRRGPPVERHDKPVRMDKARQYGYKSKQGFVVARVRVRRGSLRKARPTAGRRPKRMGARKITSTKSIQRIGEQRVQHKYPNLEVLGSWWLADDGENKWYEVLMVDPNHPQIKNDEDVGWISKKGQRKRVFRGLTSSSRTGRGLRNKGKGAEKHRPSMKSNKRKGK